ncbi:MAG: exodeoxyribonuclease VII small subunit [Ruthenibacterium sp.]
MKKGIPFEQAGAELDAILAQLSDENTPLDEALTLYAKAAELLAYCNTVLAQAQMKVDEISASIVPASEV